VVVGDAGVYHNYNKLSSHMLTFDMQRAVKKYTKKTGITIIPVILSSDKTQLTVLALKWPIPYT